jgi:hypothetical protein
MLMSCPADISLVAVSNKIHAVESGRHHPRPADTSRASWGSRLRVADNDAADGDNRNAIGEVSPVPCTWPIFRTGPTQSGDSVGVAVGVAVSVAVAVGVLVGIAVAVSVGVAVGVAVFVGVAVAIGVQVAVGVGVGNTVPERTEPP